MNEKVIDSLSAPMVVGPTPIPTGWEVVHDEAVSNASGTTGALIRNKHNGSYRLFSLGTISSIDQNYAASIDHHVPTDSESSDKLQAAITASGLTQQQIADHSGINIRQIQKYKSGEYAVGKMSSKNLLALADALGVDPRDLL